MSSPSVGLGEASSHVDRGRKQRREPERKASGPWPHVITSGRTADGEGTSPSPERKETPVLWSSFEGGLPAGEACFSQYSPRSSKV